MAKIVKKVKAAEGISEKSKIIKKVKVQKSKPSSDTSESSKVGTVKKVSKKNTNEKKIKQAASKMSKPSASPKSSAKLTSKTVKKAIKESDVVIKKSNKSETAKKTNKQKKDVVVKEIKQKRDVVKKQKKDVIENQDRQLTAVVKKPNSKKAIAEKKEVKKPAAEKKDVKKITAEKKDVKKIAAAKRDLKKMASVKNDIKKTATVKKVKKVSVASASPSKSKFSVKRMKPTTTSKSETTAKKSKTFEAGDLLSLEVGAEQEENFRKFVLPQKHKLLKKLQQADQACVMIKNLPFGMVEKNLKKYVQQFGTVLRCRMPINPRNGKAHSFAYVHYEHAEVARVACATLNNYLMLGSLLKCTLIPGRYIKEKWFAENDLTYHYRRNEGVKKMNAVKSTHKEKKLLKKRNQAAIEALKSSNSKLKPKDLGIAE